MNALLLLGGEPPGIALAKATAANAQCVVCADGAANWALPMGLKIDVLLGDMDSIEERHLHALERQGGEVHASPREKDETDGQLALDAAIARGAKHIVILGGMGGRVDHFLGNVQLLVRARVRGVEAEMRDERQRVKALNAGAHMIEGNAGEFSLLPLSADVRIAQMSGVRYPLKNVPLPLDTPLGISNYVTGDSAELRIESGWIVLVYILR